MGRNTFLKHQAELPRKDSVSGNRPRSSCKQCFCVSSDHETRTLAVTFSRDWHSQEHCTYNYHAKSHLYTPSDGSLAFHQPSEHNLEALLQLFSSMFIKTMFQLKKKQHQNNTHKELFKMCFKFNWCLCLSLSLNHTLCLAGQPDTAQCLYQSLGTSFFSRFVFSVPEDPKLDLCLAKILLRVTRLYLHRDPTWLNTRGVNNLNSKTKHYCSFSIFTLTSCLSNL